MTDKMIINKSTLQNLSKAIRDALGDDKTRNANEMITSIPDVKKKGNIEARCAVAKSLKITNQSYNNIKYKLDENSAEYICTGFATNSNIAQDVDIKEYVHIPDFPVTKLADMAFASKLNIKTATLPGSLNSNFAINYMESGMGRNRHFQSSKINTVNFGKDLKYVPYMMFDGATIQTVNLNEVEHIGPYAFKGAQLASIELPEDVKTVGPGAFASQHLQSILINKPFNQDINMPDLFVHNGQVASNLQSIFYRFTKDDGEDFLKDQASTIDKALTYFYSENYPEKTGRYWHFDSENNPSIWENYPIGNGVHISAIWDSEYDKTNNIYATHIELSFGSIPLNTFGPGIIYHNSHGEFLNININDVGNRECSIYTENPVENLYDVYNFLNKQEYYNEFKFVFDKLKEDFSYDYPQFENLLKDNRSLDLSGHFKLFYAPIRENFSLTQPLEIIANGGNIPTFKSTKKTLELKPNMLDSDSYLYNEKFYFNKDDLNDDNTFYLSGYNCIIDKSKSENYKILEEVTTKHPDYNYLIHYDIKLKLTDIPAKIYLELTD